MGRVVQTSEGPRESSWVSYVSMCAAGGILAGCVVAGVAWWGFDARPWLTALIGSVVAVVVSVVGGFAIYALASMIGAGHVFVTKPLRTDDS